MILRPYFIIRLKYIKMNKPNILNYVHKAWLKIFYDYWKSQYLGAKKNIHILIRIFRVFFIVYAYIAISFYSSIVNKFRLVKYRNNCGKNTCDSLLNSEWCLENYARKFFYYNQLNIFKKSFTNISQNINIKNIKNEILKEEEISIKKLPIPKVDFQYLFIK